MELCEDKKPIILVVDDVEINLEMIINMIEKMGYIGRGASNLQEVIEEMEKELPTLILLDIMMPEMDGYQMCEILKANPRTRKIPIIFVSAANDFDDRWKAYKVGAVDFINKPLEYYEVLIRVNIHVKLYRMQCQLEENNHRINKIIVEQRQKLEEEQKRFFMAIAKIAQSNKYVCDKKHIENVCVNSRLLAQALNFTDSYENKISGDFVDSIEIASSVHDIGKLNIAQEILRKPTALTPEEKKIIYSHTIEGEEILKAAYPEPNVNHLVQMVFDVVRYHHENWDGSGYPDGLKEDEIPLAARIVKIVDSYDCFLGQRCYKMPLSREEALEKMREKCGIRYDPYLLDVFFKIEKQLRNEQYFI